MIQPHATQDEHSRVFWRLVNKSSDCWLWQGRQNSGGYGVATLRWRRMTAHRVAWLRSGHSIEDGLSLDHLCRNKLCVKPAHLEPVTTRENLLRGDTLNAANVAKTQCLQGHPYSPENTIYRRTGARICRACNRARWHRWKANRGRVEALRRDA